MAIVVIVSEYGGTLEEAVEAISDHEGLYEGFSNVYAAETLDDLPHPMQVTAIREHFAP